MVFVEYLDNINNRLEEIKELNVEYLSNINNRLEEIKELKEEEVKQLELRNKIEIQKIAIEQKTNIVELTKKIKDIELE